MKADDLMKFREGRLVRWSVPLFLVLLLSCESQQKKEAPPPPVAPKPSPAEVEQARLQALERHKEIALAELKREITILMSHPSFEAALPKIREALAIDPEHSEFLKLQAEVTETLSHQCCGKWLRFDFTQPGSPKSLHGVLNSENLGLNYRGHPFRGRLLLACDKKAISMRLRVPWDVPEGPKTKLEYKLGEASGSEMVKTDAAPFIYEFPQPKKWFQKIAESENLTFDVKVPKRDGTIGEFAFGLGQAKQIADEVAAACK